MPPRMIYPGQMIRPPRFNGPPQPNGPAGVPQSPGGPRPAGPQGFQTPMPNYVVPVGQRSRGPARRVGPQGPGPITPGSIAPNTSAPQQANVAPVVTGPPASSVTQPNGKPRQPQQTGPNQGQRVKFSSTARNQPNSAQFVQLPNGPAQPIQNATPAPPTLPPLEQLEAMMGPEEAKQVVGEQLFVHISRQQPQLAGKITGMFLDSLDLSELVALLQSRPALDSKVLEALHVLQSANIPVDNSSVVDGQNPSVPIEQPTSA